MTKIVVKVNEEFLENKFGVEGWEIELSSSFGKTKAFVNLNNCVSTKKDQFLHGLFGNSPFTSEFCAKADLAIQEAFKNWNPSIEKIDVIVRR